MHESPIKLACRAFVVTLCLSGGSWGAIEAPAPRDVVYVNNVTGSDECDGRALEPAGKSGPFKTIMQAVRACRVGALINIANTGKDYRETVSIEKFNKGQAELPLTIDGHGACVNGLVAVEPNQWVHLRDDIYYFLNRVGDADFKPRGWFERKIGDAVYAVMPNSNWLGAGKHQGWFTEKEAPEIFFLNGKPGPSVRRLEDLPAGGFFYDTLGTTLTPTGRRCLYFRLPEGRALKDCTVELPLNHGVFVGDDYVTVCNLGSRYSQDDGFAGFWGQGVVLRNIYAGCNCDQGVSFHGNSTTLIDGALIERNGGCGIVDVMSCTTVYRHVTVRDNHPGGAKLQGFAHAMYDSLIEGNNGMQIEIGQKASVSLANCLIIGGGPTGVVPVVALNYGRMNHCTVVNGGIGVTIGVGGVIRNSIIAQCPTAVKAESNAMAGVVIERTILDLGKASLGGAAFGPENWAEATNRWRGVAGAIVDTPRLAAPSYGLPADSPHAKAGEYDTCPGATLSALPEFSVP